MDNIIDTKLFAKEFSFMFFLFSIFLHQSVPTSLGNLSISDILLLFILLYLFFSYKLYITKISVIVISFLLSFYLIYGNLLIPLIYDFNLSTGNIATGILKIIILFVFYIVGINIEYHKTLELFIKTYSWAALLIGSLGIVLSISNQSFLNDILFRYADRYNGFMNDPNYYSVLQATALPFFIRNNQYSIAKKSILSVLLVISLVLSGSKTGFLITVLYILWILIEPLIQNKKLNYVNYFYRFIFIVITVSISFFIIRNINGLIEWLNVQIPITSRITVLFEDFGSAVSDGGSSRNKAWLTAIKLIKAFPVLGIGRGNYITFSRSFFNVEAIAHNTYLQLAVEWGILLTLLFFGYLSHLLWKLSSTAINTSSLIIRDVLVIFLLGSLGISLDNARFFWLCVGIAHCMIYRSKVIT